MNVKFKIVCPLLFIALGIVMPACTDSDDEIVAAYFHALPTASGILENDSFSYGFGCALSAGASVSYKAISVGVEGVWSSIKYKQASFEDDEDDESSSGEGSADLFGTKDFRLKQKGPRFYIALRF